MLDEDLSTNLKELDELRRDLPSHLYGDEAAKMADFLHLDQQWTQMKDCVEKLKIDIVPWRKLVDVQEELQNRFDQLRGTAEEQLQPARRSGEEQDVTLRCALTQVS